MAQKCQYHGPGKTAEYCYWYGMYEYGKCSQCEKIDGKIFEYDTESGNNATTRRSTATKGRSPNSGFYSVLGSPRIKRLNDSSKVEY